jgi:hypothetical protein
MNVIEHEEWFGSVWAISLLWDLTDEKSQALSFIQSVFENRLLASIIAHPKVCSLL